MMLWRSLTPEAFARALEAVADTLSARRAKAGAAKTDPSASAAKNASGDSDGIEHLAGSFE